MSEKLEFDLAVKNNQLDKALEQATKKTFSLEGALETALGVFGGNIATKGLEFLGDRFSDVINFSKESIAAYSEQEDALNKLNQALRATGAFSQEAVDSVSEFASALQKTSVFGDEAIIGQVAFVKSLGATTEQSKALVQAAANLSSVLGGSLEDNTDKLGKTLSGTAGRLAQYIPELKNLTEEQLKAGKAAEIINEKYSGAAANDLKTYSGSVVAAKNAFSDLQEEIGGLLVDNALVAGSIKLAKDAFEGITRSVVNLKEKIDGTDPFNKVSKTSQEAATQVVRLNEEIAKLQKDLEFNQKFSPGYAQVISLELDKIIKKRDEVEEKLQFNKIKSPIAEEEKQPTSTRSLDLIEAEKKLQADLSALRLKFATEEQTFNDQLAIAQQEQSLIRGEDITTQVYDQKIREAQAAYEAKLIENSLLKDADAERLANQQAALVKEQSLITAGNAKRLIDEKNAKAGQVALEASFQNSRNTLIGQGFALAGALAKDGSKAQFIIQKAAALAEIAIADGKARALIPAQTALIPFPGNLAAAASLNAYVTAQTALGAAIVGATAIKGFAEGGIVGATNGEDNRLATVRDGEMILNAGQQKKLFDSINGGGLGGGGDIVVQIDGFEVFRAIRRQLESGAKFA